MDQSASMGAPEHHSGIAERTVPLSPPSPPEMIEHRATGEPELDAVKGPIAAAADPGSDELSSPAPTLALRQAFPPRWRLLAWRRAVDRARKEWVAEARVPLTEPVRVVVASPKGGVGKTTVALALAERIAALRADRVGVLDAQPLGGTAGMRVAGQRGLGLPALLGQIDEVASDGSYTAWSRFATIEHETRVTVFGRAEPMEGAELSVTGYRLLVTGLARQWPIMVVDTGAPEGLTALQVTAVESADVLVVVCGPGSPTVAATAGWLRDVPVPRARRVGVVVPLTGGDVRDADALMESTCGSVVEVPVDRAFAAEAAMPLVPEARAATRDATTQLAAMVMRASQSSPDRE